MLYYLQYKKRPISELSVESISGVDNETVIEFVEQRGKENHCLVPVRLFVDKAMTILIKEWSYV